MLLQFVARELAESPVLVVAMYRDTEIRPDHPLTGTWSSWPDVARLLELTTGDVPSEGLVAAVHRETDGNPLFVEELLRLLAQEGCLESADEAASWRLPIPRGVKQVIGRRLDHLSEDCKRVLTVASVLGREFNPDVLNRVIALSGDRLLDALDGAASERVVTEAPGAPGHLRFSHALVRDVLYDDLSPTRRVRLHRQIGEAIEVLYATNLNSHLPELA